MACADLVSKTFLVDVLRLADANTVLSFDVRCGLSPSSFCISIDCIFNVCINNIFQEF